MSTEIEESYFDEVGNEIMEGDLLQVYHFRGRSKKKHYMYHIVVLTESFIGDKLWWGAKQYHVTKNKSHYRFLQVASPNRKIPNIIVLDSIDAMRDHKRSNSSNGLTIKTHNQ